MRRSFEYFRYVHLGTQFCVLVVGGVLGGWWLDGQLGILPLFTIVGSLLGTGVATYILYRSVFDRKSR